MKYRATSFLTGYLAAPALIIVLFFLLAPKEAAAQPRHEDPQAPSSLPELFVQPIPYDAAGSTSEAINAPAPDTAVLVPRLSGSVEALVSTETLMRAEEAATSGISSITERIGRDVEVSVRAHNSTVRRIRGEVLVPKQEDASLEPAVLRNRMAASFFGANRDLLRLDDPSGELLYRTEEQDESGRARIRYQQQFMGIPVWGAELSAHFNADGDLDLIDGAYFPTPRRSRAIASVDRARAEAIAVGDEASSRVLGAELVFYSRSSFSSPRLAWKVLVERDLLEVPQVFVDAQHGVVLGSVETVNHQAAPGSGRDLHGRTVNLVSWRSNGTHYLIDTSKPMYKGGDPLDPNTPGIITTVDARGGTGEGNLRYVTSSSASSWNPPDAVSAAQNSSVVYDYFRQVHKRDSYDNRGRRLLNIVRVAGDFVNNAAYVPSLGDAMVYGVPNGLPMSLAGALDVAGHEMAHGVGFYSAGLMYQNESGAMEEALADIHGEAAERYVTGSNDWLLGADVHVLRSMRSPEDYGDPSHYSDYRKMTRDHGGVHTNSGIINHAFYLIAEGGPKAIGFDKALAIFYRAQTRHLTKHSQFRDLRDAALDSARELHGANSAEYRGVQAGFDAVGIRGTEPAPPPPPKVPPVAGNDATLFTFFDRDAGRVRLGRKESQLKDPEFGVILDQSGSVVQKPHVTGNGNLAFFVAANNDACFIDTRSGEESCLGVPGAVHSVAMSPSGHLFAFVLRDVSGQPTSQIHLINLATDQEQTVTLEGATSDGGAAGIAYADALDFSGNNRFLFYDALNVYRVGGQEVSSWSIYALDLVTGTVFSVAPPAPGVEMGFPSVANTDDQHIVFELYDVAEDVTNVVTLEFYRGDYDVPVAFRGTPAAASYTGDDRAVVFSAPDGGKTPTGAGLWRVPLAGDKITPTGEPRSWMADATMPAIYRRGTYKAPTLGCKVTEDEFSLCLNKGRFKVEAFWANKRNEADGGIKVPLTPDTGYFYFFDQSNVELVVKVLNACNLNGSYWVFAAGLTDVGVTLRVTDTATGVAREYANPVGSAFSPVQDTQGFRTCSIKRSTEAGSVATAGDIARDLPERWSLAEVLSIHTENLASQEEGACAPGSLCLNQDRFRIRVAFRDKNGNEGAGQPVQLTKDTGYFWFFKNTNVELLVKVLDARKLNGHFWVFAGGLTDVEVLINVQDTVTGREKNYYSNGAFQPVLDTEALRSR